jgi:hypothetical protein
MSSQQQERHEQSTQQDRIDEALHIALKGGNPAAL